MLNFTKRSYFKLIVLTMAGTLFFESTIYGTGLSDGKHLRIPLTGTARIGESHKIYQKEKVDFLNAESNFKDKNNPIKVRVEALDILTRLLEEKEVREKGSRSKVKMREFLFSVLDNAGDEEIEVLVRAIKLLRIFLLERLYEHEVIEKYKEVYSRLKSKELRKEVINSFGFTHKLHPSIKDFLSEIIEDEKDYECCRDSARDILRILRKKKSPTNRTVSEITYNRQSWTGL